VKKCFALLVLGLTAFLAAGCTRHLTTEETQRVAELKEELHNIRQQVAAAKVEDAGYSGGLIKSLIRIRLEVLQTNQALIEQHIHLIETGASTRVVVNVAKPDPVRAGTLANEIEAQKAKVAQARTEAAQYSGGLVQAMAITNVVTSENTLTLLEQQYEVAKFGLAIPVAVDSAPAQEKAGTVAAANAPSVPTAPEPSDNPKECLKFEGLDSSVLSSNDVFTELAWKVDVVNSCAEPYSVKVVFTIYDKSEFELDNDTQNVYVPSNGVGKARGKMLVSPPEKARRMAKQGVTMSLH
jgi:hypothetical protein